MGRQILPPSKTLAHRAWEGDAVAAFHLCRRRQFDKIDDLISLVAPARKLNPVAADACLDGWSLWQSWLHDPEAKRDLDDLVNT